MEDNSGYHRIVTHHDFDGLVSAAICSFVTGCERVIFAGPNTISRSQISIDTGDIVCDLPYPLECGLWFDHHAGNLEEVRLRGIDPDDIPGGFGEEPSCARVIYRYFRDRGEELPGYLGDTVDEADRIDSFDYRSVGEWREETPGKLVDMSLKAPFDTPGERTRYLEYLTALLRHLPLEEILSDQKVKDNLHHYRVAEKKMIKIIGESIKFHPRDSEGEIVIVDLLRHNRRPRVVRNLAFLLHPRAKAVVLLMPLFRQRRKTNDFSISMSLSFTLTGKDHGKDIGEIMRTLNIGDGHAGAAAGMVRCDSKVDRIRSRKKLLDNIWELWSRMPG